MTQEELLPLLVSKDDRAFTMIYDCYAKSLYAVIENIVRNPLQSEAILQEVFVTIWRTSNTYTESKGRIYTWMLHIARTAAMEKMQFNGVEKSTLNTDNFVHLINKETRMPNRIEALGVQEFVKKIKPKCIQMIDLMFFKNYTLKQMETEMEISQSAIQVQNRNCITDLRTYLEA
jgi:RNA polymerase sigma-70 factor (ECF subfamily)